jgi:hypothetical protein
MTLEDFANYAQIASLGIVLLPWLWSLARFARRVRVRVWLDAE